MVLAWTDEEEAALPALMAQARTNGVGDVAAADGRRGRSRSSPELSPSVRAAFRVPREYLIDPWSAPHAYLLQAIDNGAVLRRDCEVTGRQLSTAWRGRLDTSRGGDRGRVSSSTRPGSMATSSTSGCSAGATSHQAAQGPVRRLRQAARPGSRRTSCCRCRARPPRASSSAAPPSAISSSARPPRSRRTRDAPNWSPETLARAAPARRGDPARRSPATP